MTDKEALKLALEALYPIAHNTTDDPRGQAYKAITVIKEALAEHAMREVQRLGQEIEQKIGCVNHDCERCKQLEEQAYDLVGELRVANIKLSMQPPRTWVGLEKSDMPDGADPLFDDPKFIAGMVYAANKLKKKNT